MEKSRVLRSNHVAHLLDMPPDDVISLARTGKLRGVKKGKYWLFRLRDVNVYKKKIEH